MAHEYILIIDDESEISEIIGLYLEKEGFHYSVAYNGEDGINAVLNKKPDLILLDIFLPDFDGFEVCRKIRTFTDTPILILSCKDSEFDKIIGLSIGADDYISKPFSVNELIARVKAHLRRNRLLTKSVAEQPTKSEDVGKKVYVSKSLKIDMKRHEVFLHNHPLYLPVKEFQLLSFFMKHPKQVFSIEHLLDRIWGFDELVGTKTVNVHIGSLRKKIEKNPRNPEIITTIRGVGYRFNEMAQQY
ncbi:response regulator [Schinkia sp. CFF1]